MKRHGKVRVLLLLIGCLPLPLLPIDKGNDNEGRISFVADNRRIIEASPRQSTGFKEATGQVGSVLITVPGVGEVSIMTFKHWVVQVEEEGPGPTLNIKSDSMKIQLTFIPHSVAAVLNEEELKADVRRMGEQYVGTSIEQAVYLKRLRTTLGTAILANFNEQKYENAPVPRGQYSSITIGQIDHRLMSVAVTILTNGPDTRAHDDALLVLDSIVTKPR